ncbi:MAG: anti-sigma factor antagonist [Pseudonocardia sp.]
MESADQDAERSELMPVDITRAAEAVVVAVGGEIDNYTAELLRSTIADALAGAAGERVVLDLTRVEFVNSSGAAVLMGAVGLAEQHRAPLRVVVARPGRVLRALEVTGIAPLLPLCDTLDDALRGPS